MTHKQKPESAEFRAREAQVDEIHDLTARSVCHGRSDFPSDIFRAYLEVHLLEAEARGAAEQRRKDAEGEIHIVFSGPPDHDMPHLIEVENASGHSIPAGEWRKRDDGLWSLVFHQPANVAALEARVKELEGAKGRKQEEARRYRNALANIVAKTGSHAVAHKIALEALAAIREGGEHG